jgi:hypothetical protein
MKSPNRLTLIVPTAGIGIGVVVVVYVVMSALTTISASPCSTRYPAPTEWALRTETGETLSPIELQARAGLSEWGFLENVQVQHLDGQSPPLVLAVKLAKGTSSAFQTKSPTGGAGFRWAPASMRNATAACLSYGLWLPDDFDFGAAGSLPGLYGGFSYDPLATPDGKNGFAMRLMWREGGAGEVNVQIPGEGGNNLPIGLGTFTFPRGRWINIEEEVVLNAPSASDGLVRLWVDGTLKVERQELAWRSDDALKISGLLAEVAYGGVDSEAVAPNETALRLTPFAIRWQ